MWLDDLNYFFLDEIDGLGSQHVQQWLTASSLNLSISSSSGSLNMLLVGPIRGFRVSWTSYYSVNVTNSWLCRRLILGWRSTRRALCLVVNLLTLASFWSCNKLLGPSLADEILYLFLQLEAVFGVMVMVSMEPIILSVIPLAKV